MLISIPIAQCGYVRHACSNTNVGGSYIMGMFDSVWVKCPNCGEENEFQSKSGECTLRNVDLADCPDDILENVNRHSPCHCDCGTFYKVDIPTRTAVVVTDVSG